ncbi:choice-of-anchor C family protein, partial [Chloroflexota bacterium]
MNKKLMKMKRFGWIIIIPLLLMSIPFFSVGAAAASGGLTNEGFEAGNLSGWSTSIPGGGSATAVTSFTVDGNYSPKKGSYFALLKSNYNEGVYTTISQSFTAMTGQTIDGWAFFNTTDYSPYNDDGFVRIKNSGGAVIATLFSSSVSAVGDYGETPWTYWAYNVPSSGTYTLEAGVRNVRDGGVDSYIGLDSTEFSPPIANAGGPYTVNEGSSITLNGSGYDPEGNPVSFAWDLDNDGQYDDATGASPVFSAAGIDGPASRNIGLQVSESASIFWDFSSSPYVGVSNSPTLSGVANNTTGHTEGTYLLTRPIHGSSYPYFDFTNTETMLMDSISFYHSHNHNPGYKTNPDYKVQLQIDSGGGYTNIGSPLTVNNKNSGHTSTIDLGSVVVNRGNHRIRWYAYGFHSAIYPDTEFFAIDNVTFNLAGLEKTTSATTVTVNNVAPVVDTGIVDLNSWTPESLGGASWNVQPGGDTVLQTVNGDPTFFYSDFNAIGEQLRGKITVQTSGDDDYIGFAFGFQPGDTTSSSADYLLVDWKQTYQPWSGYAPGKAGLAVSRVNGAAVYPYTDFWGHTGVVTELARGASLGNTGWADYATYDFQFEYSANRLQVFVNGIKEIDITGSFPQGRFAFYNYSQSQVQYAAIQSDSIAGDEGSVISLSKDFTDAGTMDTHTAIINWGDSTTSAGTITEAGGSGTVTGSHVYADDGTYTVTVTVTDDDGAPGSDTLTATVGNVAPTIDTGIVDLNSWTAETIGGPSQSNWTVQSGGNSVFQSINGQPTFFYSDFNALGSQLRGNITVEESGGDDDFIGFAIGFQPGDTTNPNADYLLVDWKQGNQSGAYAGLAVSRVQGYTGDFWRHTNGVTELQRGANLGYTGWSDWTTYDFQFEYSQNRLQVFVNGTLELDITGNFPDGRFAFYNYSQSYVRYAAVQSDSIGGDEGSVITLSKDSKDMGTLDVHSATINWGDGTATEAGLVTESPFGPPGSTSGASATISGSHVYADNGTYTVTITVYDDEGASGSDTLTATVANVAPTLVLSGNANVNEGSVYTLNLASSDPGTDTITSWKINWGDGNIQTVSGNPSSVTHIYPDGPAGYTISAQAMDEDGIFNSNSINVTVHNVAPDLTIGGANSVYYVDWTSANVGMGTASGVINLPDGSAVTVTFEAVYPNGAHGSLYSAQTSGGINYWNPSTPYISTLVPNAPPTPDILQLSGGTSQIYKVTLSEPIVDPIMAIVSLGSTYNYTRYDFDSPFTIVSQAAGYFGGGSNRLVQESGDVLRGNEGHGTIRFLGTFDTFSWTVPTPETWHGFTFGIRATEALADTVFVDEGETATNSGTWSDPGIDEVTLTASAGTVVKNSNGTWNWAMNTNDGPTQSQTITITATDEDGASTSKSFPLVVQNVAAAVTVTGSSIDENNLATVSGMIDDPSSQDTFTVTIDWGEGVQNYNYPAGTTTFSETRLYPDDNPSGTPVDVYAIGVTVTDDDGGVGTAATGVTVSNISPTVEAGPDAVIDEGDTFLGSGSFTDPGADTWMATVNYGDGSGNQPLSLNADKTFSLSHLYADNGTYTVTVIVTDDDLGVGSDTLPVTVNNIAPVVTATGSTIDENGVATVSGTITDPGIQDGFTVVIDWGEGTPQTYTYSAGTTTYSETHQYLDDNPTGTASDVYNIGVTVTDKDSGVGAASTTVTVNNVAPSVNAGPDAIVDEGETFVSMPSGLISWWSAEGNANDSADGNDGVLSGSATIVTNGAVGQAFSFNGVYGSHVGVPAASNLEMSSAVTMQAWIYPTGPGMGSAGGIIINREGEYEMARFGDGTIRWAFCNAYPGWTWIDTGYVAPLNQWTHVAVTYDNGLVQTYANGSLVHQYSGSGTIGDNNNGSPYELDELWIGGRQAGPHNFQGLIDEAAVFNRALSGVEIQSLYGNGGVPGGSFTDPGADTWTATVNYGDGTGEQPLSLNADKTFSLSHVYADNGTYTVAVTVTDDDGGVGTDTLTVTVNNVAPTVNAGPDKVSNEGDLVTLAHNIITNGSFESGPDLTGYRYITRYAGNTSITGWTISGSGIDYINGVELWDASDGNCSIDLNSSNTGAISQTIPTIPGLQYEVIFDMAGNYGSIPTVKTMRVSAGSSYADYTFDTTGKSARNMGWETKSFTFTATSQTTTIKFASLVTGGYGPAIDNVMVLEPATFNDLGTLDTHTA